MIIEKQIAIHIDIDSSWKVIGLDFAHPYKWASGVNHSEGHGKHLGNTTCDARACKIVLGNIEEKLTYYSDENFHLAYIVTEGMPKMVKTATNEWKLTFLTSYKTKLNIKMEFIFQGILGVLMQPLMKIKLKKMAQEMVEEFAFYVEKGNPHPRKIKAMKKNIKNILNY